MPAYKVLEGKHWTREGGALTPYPAGSIVELDEKTAAAFPGRFQLVKAAEPESEPEPEEKAPARGKK